MMMREMKVVGLVVCLVMAATVNRGEGMSCEDAVMALVPCATFLLGDSGPKPSADCCTKAQSLNKMANSTASRRAICECFKEDGPSFGVKPERAKQLPSLCKLNANIPISPTVDCNKVT